MSNRNYYSKYSRRPGRKREIIATDEMKKLLPTSRICTNTERDTLYIYNGSAKPVKAQYIIDDPMTTVNGLKQKTRWYVWM